jgi:hypothetical protein
MANNNDISTLKLYFYAQDTFPNEFEKRNLPFDQGEGVTKLIEALKEDEAKRYNDEMDSKLAAR